MLERKNLKNMIQRLGNMTDLILLIEFIAVFLFLDWFMGKGKNK